ncbi:Oidioi.mRNA.OKI2018_I69.PAR.g12467.t1.cds [Oikopleura dioica]|uniref:NAD(+) ADP-ribosyltransferase n=1 Tax=Oikopleura dioica TaxID=34765 RepID=A0ABN7S3P4_OIKDI|nr:Oidioi.mRNA.OKI2018_I69.PAR.g12467.t1.cds [Oikopleura dioica]
MPSIAITTEVLQLKLALAKEQEKSKNLAQELNDVKKDLSNEIFLLQETIEMQRSVISELEKRSSLNSSASEIIMETSQVESHFEESLSEDIWEFCESTRVEGVENEGFKMVFALSQEVDELKDELVVNEEKLNDFRAEIATLTENLRSEKSQKIALDRNNIRLISDNEEIKEENRQLRQTKSTLESKLQRINIELASQKIKNETLAAKLEECTNSLKETKDHFKWLKILSHQPCDKCCPECGQQLNCHRACGDCDGCGPCQAFVEKEYDCGHSAHFPCNFQINLKECEACEDERIQNSNNTVDKGAPGFIQKNYRVFIGKEGRRGHIAYDLTLVKNDINTAANICTFMQLLKHKDHEKYMVWERTSSIDNMQDSMEPGKEFDSIGQAKYYWGRRFKSKTGNIWANYPKFDFMDGKFTVITRNHEIEDKVDDNLREELEPKVNDLMKMICDQNMLQQAANDIALDTQKVALGYLSEDQERLEN